MEKSCSNCRYEPILTNNRPCTICIGYCRWQSKESEKKMPKFKVGDKVKVKEGLKVDTMYGEITFLPEMLQYSGKPTVIDTIPDWGNYTLDIDWQHLNYSEDMLEKIVEGKEMRTYKLEEIVKMVRENPKLKVESNRYGGKGFSEQTFTQDFINADFRIKQEPVTFMEAAKALMKGKTIRCNLNDFDRIYNGRQLLDQNGNCILPIEILKGKWFIKEAE